MRQTTFLVVDDHTSMRLIVANCLTSQGVSHIVQAASGLEAMERIERGCIQFVISDWNMEGMNGLELLRQVRGSSKWAYLPFLLATADNGRENVIEAARLGADGYLVKPFKAASLIDKVNAVLRKRQAAAYS
jgi:two-component system chemotaxis response regulator CheY